MKKSFTYLIYTNSNKEHDIFFYKVWKIDEDLIGELKSTFSKLKTLKIIVFDFPVDSFYKEIRNIKIPTTYSENNVSLNSSFINKFIEEIDTETIEKYYFNSFSVSKNLMILDKIKSIISEKSNTIWTNELDNDIEYTLKFENIKIVEDDLLYDFVNRGFSKKCFGLQIESESPYEDKTFKSFLNNKLSSCPKFNEMPKRCQYTFSIEKNYSGESDRYFNYPLKISLFNFTDIPYNTNKKYDTILEEEINFFGSYDYEQNKNIYFFLIEESLIEKLHKINKVISDNFCINWIDEHYFLQEFKNIKFKQTQIGKNRYTSIWSNYYVHGLELRYKEYYHRYSDFGSDNDLLVVNGDSRYLDLINKKPIYVECNPRGTKSNSNGRIESTGEYYGLEENIFEYFFENKKFLITNIDDIHYIGYSYSDCGLEGNKKSIVSKKVILIPEILLEDSFILTQDYFPY